MNHLRHPRPHGLSPALRFAGATLTLTFWVAARPAAGADAPSARSLTAELREANYNADAAAAQRLRDRFRELATHPAGADRALAYYQAGTASGLLAAFVAPGSVANAAGDPPAMLRHMQEAAEDLERAVAVAPDFADAHVALANNYGIRIGLEPDRAADLAARSKAARERALTLGPRNPRVVIGHAGLLFWAPPQAGGNRERGMARYREALELFAAEPVAERELHAWGEPDAWAFLAFAELARERPDLTAARAAIERALALRPDFAWARGVVLPQVERAMAAARAAAATPTGG
jgi:tetratricopeptide (TPR) repeat protein